MFPPHFTGRVRENVMGQLTEFGQRVLDFEVVLVESQQPLGDVEGVVTGTAGDGVRPGVQADLGDTKGKKSGSVRSKTGKRIIGSGRRM